MIKQFLLVFFAALCVQTNLFAQQAGDLDRSFNYGRGSNYQFNDGNGASFEGVEITSIQTDGKILIGGRFTSFNGIARNRVTRLNTDGGLDMSFNPTGKGADTTVLTIAIQPDGKILIGGSFKYYNGVARNRIARLNSDGSLDNSFNPGLGTNGPIRSIVLQSSGKILIGGEFTTYNGVSKNGIARLNSDGGIDNSFNQGTCVDNAIHSVALQPNGKILIGGVFTTYNGATRKGIARLNPDGSLDSTFKPNIPGRTFFVFSTILQTDGKVLIGVLHDSKNYIARLNSDGSLDNNFNTNGLGKDCNIFSIALQSDGKILIGGGGRYSSISGNKLARLNSDGSMDNSFNMGTGANDWINSVLLQPDGKIIISGGFSSYNNLSTHGICRILGSNIASLNKGNKKK